jgi:DNA invertase Pin-like site-specific DNA recombinase
MAAVSRLEQGRKPAGIYVRISSDRRGGAQVGQADQERQVRDLAKTHRWDVVDVYIDNEIANRGRKTRIEFNRLTKDIRDGRIKAVGVWHIDRLTRKPSELEPFLKLADKSGVDLATYSGEVDLGTDAGRAFARQLAAFSRHEEEHRAELRHRRHETDADSGKAWRAGSRCYGYKPDGMEIVESEAEVIRDVAERVRNGESLRAIAISLNNQEKLTTWGKTWHPTGLKRLLLNPRLTGRRVYRGKVSKAEWPPILTVKVQNELERLLEARKLLHGHTSTPRKYLLTGGLLICGLCGSTLVSQPSAGNKRGYVCRKAAGAPGCGKIRIGADPIETEVTEVVLARLASPSIRRRIAAALGGNGSSEQSHLDNVASYEADLVQLGRDYADRLIKRVEFLAARDRLEELIQDARRDAAAAARIRSLPAPDPKFLAAWWEEADLPSRRDMVATVLDHIVVGPATKRGPVGLDADRLTWVWRAS